MMTITLYECDLCFLVQDFYSLSKLLGGGGGLGPPSVRHCNLVDIIRLVASLFQQVRHIDDITILLQLLSSTLLHFCYIMTVSNLLEQPCNKSDNAIKLQVQVVNSLFQTRYNNWEQAIRTQLIDSL